MSILLVSLGNFIIDSSLLSCYAMYKNGGENMKQGERVKEIRKSLGLTLEKFGLKLGVQKSAISKLENDENKLTKQMATAICNAFNVNYFWLINGEGEMFTAIPETIIDEVVDEFELDENDKIILTAYLNATPEERKNIKNFLLSIAEKLQKKDGN